MHSTTANAVATPNGALVHGLTLIAALGGLLFGYDTAVISGAVSAIDANFITPRGLSETSASSLSGWAVSCALLGCTFGGLIAGWLATHLGRKGGLIVAAVLFLVSAIGSAYPEMGLGATGSLGVNALTPFIAYRVIGGLGIGIA
jgi:SP family xylose:H+ symportor-like MFS transporter